MKKLLILFFLASCVSPKINVNPISTSLDFDKNLSFEDFNELIIEYAKRSPYPNIDK